MRLKQSLGNQRQYSVIEDISIKVFALNPLDFIVDNLEHLIRHDKIVFLPNVYLLLAREFPFRACAQIDFDDLEIIISRLHNVAFVKTDSLKDAGQFEDGKVEQFLGRLFLCLLELCSLARAVQVK